MKNTKFSSGLCKVQFVLEILVLSFVRVVHADPIQPPNLDECRNQDSGCCILLPQNEVLNFSFDMYPQVKKVRASAHLVDNKYIAKYKKGYELLRSLPLDDPRSLMQQANAHCSMCTSAYLQPGTNAILQVHFSWLFLPWHRWFIYFHERILGKLLRDPSFSLPFWDWDNQIDGNFIPIVFNDKNSALYDSYRDATHSPPTLIQLDGGDGIRERSEIVAQNLLEMYQVMVVPSTADVFMGGAFRHGDNYSSSDTQQAAIGGIMDNTVHSRVHWWVGDPVQPNRSDMGTFSTAARDPIFYAHHANVDRLWEIWRTSLPGGPRQVFTDPDFLDASFVFYDENANLVRVTIRDSLDNEKLGVKYSKVEADKLWINYVPGEEQPSTPKKDLLP
ncbi:hypothetical protein GOP47_0030152 [Adiantum capillus-veneris]|nr:hypothetical protein GOP47_0030152 [Adiantum capillus-veneris]